MSPTTTKVVTSARQSPEQFADHLDEKVRRLLSEIERSEVYRSVFDPNAEPRYVATVIKYILLEIFSYGPHLTEATFTAIGRMPKSRPDIMKVMIKHDLDEVNHGEMALRDFVKLGGDEQWARSRHITPASFVMSAVVRLLADHECPFAYLGYMYPLESLSPILAERAQRQMAAKEFPNSARRFIDVHAVEDLAHSKLVRRLIEQAVEEYPEAASPIEYAFDCFTQVHPLPIWNAAMQAAQAELAP